MTRTVPGNAPLRRAFEKLPKEQQVLVMARAAVSELNKLEKGNRTSNFSPTNEYELVGLVALPDTHAGILSEGSAIPKVVVRGPLYPLSSFTEANTFAGFGLHSNRREIGGEVMYVLRELRVTDEEALEQTDYALVDDSRAFAVRLRSGGYGGLVEL